MQLRESDDKIQCDACGRIGKLGMTADWQFVACFCRLAAETLISGYGKYFSRRSARESEGAMEEKPITRLAGQLI